MERRQRGDTGEEVWCPGGVARGGGDGPVCCAGRGGGAALEVCADRRRVATRPQGPRVSPCAAAGDRAGGGRRAGGLPMQPDCRAGGVPGSPAVGGPSAVGGQGRGGACSRDPGGRGRGGACSRAPGCPGRGECLLSRSRAAQWCRLWGARAGRGAVVPALGPQAAGTVRAGVVGPAAYCARAGSPSRHQGFPRGAVRAWCRTGRSCGRGRVRTPCRSSRQSGLTVWRPQALGRCGRALRSEPSDRLRRARR